MTEPNTERFHRNANGPPDRWHPPDRDMGPIMRLRSPNAVPVAACLSERTRDYIRLQETIPYFKTIKARTLTLGRRNSPLVDVLSCLCQNKSGYRPVHSILSLTKITRLPLAQFHKQWGKRQEVACFKLKSRRTKHHATKHKH